MKLADLKQDLGGTFAAGGFGEVGLIEGGFHRGVLFFGDLKEFVVAVGATFDFLQPVAVRPGKDDASGVGDLDRLVEQAQGVHQVLRVVAAVVGGVGFEALFVS